MELYKLNEACTYKNFQSIHEHITAYTKLGHVDTGSYIQTPNIQQKEKAQPRTQKGMLLSFHSTVK